MIQALIVDDEPNQLQGLVKHIRWNELGYKPPITSECGEEALAILERSPIDVLISDVSMPGMTGIELLARCKQDFPQLQRLQTVLISGHDEFEFVQEAIHLGAQAYVLKPIRTDELEEKLRVFRTMIEKSRQIDQETSLLKEKVSESIEVLQDRFVNDMIEGRLQHQEFMDSWTRLLELPRKDWIVRLFLFGYDKLHESPLQDARKRILLSDGLLRAVKVGMDGFTGIFIGRTGADEVAVIQVNASPIDSARIEKQFSFVQGIIQEQYEESVTIGVSRVHNAWRDIAQLYKEVKHMVAKGKREGRGLIHYFDDFDAIDYREFQLREEDIPEIVSLLEKGDAEQAIIHFNHVFDMLLVQNAVSFSYVQAFGMGLISELTRTWKHTQESGGEISVNVWQHLIHCTAASEIRDIILDYIARYSQHNSKELEVQQHHLIHRIERYLEEHLSASVTVKQLAEQFHLNPSYLSVLFKKETKKTISEFVQETRMNKAKELLRDPSVKVYEVAEQVGFQTSAYFAFLFKKNIGVTPQEFRDHHYGE